MSPMNIRTARMTSAAFALTLLAGAVLAAQHTQPAQPTQPTPPPAPVERDGYREAIAYEGSTTIQTSKGPKTLKIVIKKLMIDNRKRSVKIALPGKGLAILQHRAGEVEIVIIGETRHKPLEGERLIVNLPQPVILNTADDSVLIDAIILAE
jgi:hypothetical protein